MSSVMTASVASDVRRDRFLALASLLAIAALAWLYLWIEAGRMDGMSGSAGAMDGAGAAGTSKAQAWSVWSLLLTFVMWSA